jgi:xylulose-5-phosphate/fructose-6-phosphate phosphoketolase
LTELGYALAVAYGSVMDKPDLIAAVIVGDGEAETGPTATAWHAHKYIDPSESGAVLPILHLNRFKISESTIFGTMDRKELLALYTGYGYQVRFVDYVDHVKGHTLPGDESVKPLDELMAATVQWAIDEIDKIQTAARSGKAMIKPRWPMIIMATPKGWGCPPELDGKMIEGSFRSHQVPVGSLQDNKEHFKILNDWLLSYDPRKWFQVDDKEHLTINPIVTRILPKDQKNTMGQLRELYDKTPTLDLAYWGDFGSTNGKMVSSMQVSGKLLADAITRNPRGFRIFSPDELESNKLDAVFEVKGIGHRNLQTDPTSMITEPNKGGRIIEMLSEHTLQGFAQGYCLTGRTCLFPSYESFIGVSLNQSIDRI